MILKSFLYGEMFLENQIIKEHYCDRCAKYGVKQRLQKIDVEPLEIKDILKRTTDFPISLYLFVYRFYNNFECPICHWHKLVQK